MVFRFVLFFNDVFIELFYIAKVQLISCEFAPLTLSNAGAT